MKKFLALTIALIAISSVPTNGQSLKDALKGIFNSSASQTNTSNESSSNSGGSILSSIFGNLIGNSSVSSKSIVGTWTYNEPAVAFESKNSLAKIGGKLATNKIQQKLGSSLSKYGISQGITSITFAADSTFKMTAGKKTVSGKYALDKNTITLYTIAKLKIATANIALSGNNMQLTFKADKLLTFAQTIGSATASANSTLSTISALAKNYSGMQLGMQLEKK